MCGLVGIRRFTADPIDPRELVTMRKGIRHRGPDDWGLYVDDEIGLGHARLAILDLSRHASQPMTSRCGRYTIAYNGEIYNFKGLREQLIERGIKITSSGDTEVLLEYFAAFGVEDALQTLEGFFAFALWDRKTKRLTLARDRHGIKPLYYTTDSEHEVRFASEVKVLLKGDTQPDACTLNAAMLGQGCTWGQHTLYRGILRVQPGEVVVFHESNIPQRHRFIRLTDFVDRELHEQLSSESDEVLVDRVEEALQKSIDMRLISDAPLACLASGGVDSSLIAAMARRRNPDMLLYHADVAGDSERVHAESLAAHLNADLRVVAVSDERFLDHLPAVTFHNDAPVIYHPNSVPFYAVSQRASHDGIKVILTGEGSDEYFMGYPGTALMHYISAYRRTLKGFQDFAHWCFPRAAQLLVPRRTENRAELLRRLLFRFDEELVNLDSEAAVGHVVGTRDRKEQITSLCLTQPHLTTLLHRNDRLAMAWGIESRFPFLGHDLARLAVNLPGRVKLRRTWAVQDRRHPFVTDKWCVRKLAERYLPKHLARRPKKGFPVSIASRLEVSGEFFYDGFMADWYGLSRRAIDHLLGHSTPGWISHLLFAEVWAQLFMMRRSIEEVGRYLRCNVRLQSTSTPHIAKIEPTVNRPQPALT
ncbi:MAG: asparagine synthase (glutamine-hydrolyzing) [Planctomycetes bacterium]|nr:asparagine synthase (glutamine-hydrolyzing) [Planctomycetota bacterium]